MRNNHSPLSPLTSHLKIVFLGTPEIGAEILDELLKSGVKVDSVVTQPDRPCGRGCKTKESEVKKLALENQIKVYQPNTKLELIEVIKKIKPDLGIVAAYGMIIPNEALEIPGYGMINFHPSLLPELRGPSPIPMAIMCGHKKTGVTIIQVDEKMDAGDILVQQEVELTGNETTPSLSNKLARLGAKMLLEIIPDIEAGNIKTKKQDESKATFTPIVKKEDGEIVFHEYWAQNIEQAARAFVPWPGIFTFWKGKRLELFEPEVVKVNIKPGLVQFIHGRIVIGTAKDSIAPKFFKIEGKNKQTAKDFLCGYQDFIGTILN